MATRIRTLNFLPEIFQTPTNQQFLSATLDQLVAQPNFKKIEGYIGSRLGYGINANSYYVTEPNKIRTDYQLDPGIVVTKENQITPRDFISYPGIIDSLKLEGALTDNNSRLFTSDIYSWDSFTNLDKIINFNQYYWLPNGPELIDVAPPVVYMVGDYTVTSNSNSYNLELNTDPINTVSSNPTITLLRGGTYTFSVNQATNFWIQGAPGITGIDPTNVNLQTREVLGVTNNGINNGTITFTVPAANAQDNLKFESSTTVDLVSTLTFNQINGQLLSSITSIDGITSLNGLTVLLYNGDISTSVNFYTISYTGLVANPTLNLTPATAIPINTQINVLYGQTFGNRSFYKAPDGSINLIPYLSAELTTLYYQDSTNPNKVGIIKIIENNDQSFINVETEILGKPQYTTETGIKFTNGLKVEFVGNVIPTSYKNTEFYVENVGIGIQLIPVNSLVTPETYTETIDVGYSVLPYDSTGFDGAASVPVDPDYITIARNSISRNAWSRSNRWFHIETIRTSAQFNNDLSIVDLYATTANKAKRPIIEFYPNLQLFDSGIEGKQAVDFIDTRTTSAFTDVADQTQYYPDVEVYTTYTATIASTNYTVSRYCTSTSGTDLICNSTTGFRVGDLVNFPAGDATPSPLVAGTNYYIVDISSSTNFKVSATKNGTAISLSAFSPTAPGRTFNWTPQSTAITIASSAVSRGTLAVGQFIADSSGILPSNTNITEITGTTTLTVIVSWDQTTGVYFDSASNLSMLASTLSLDNYALFDGATIVFTNDETVKNKIFVVNFNPTINLYEVVDGTVLPYQQTVALRGFYNVAKEFYYNGLAWQEAQQKVNVNQAPLFDIVDENGISFGNREIYNSSTFNGTKLFSYTIGTGNDDPILGIPLSYSSVENVGDISFDVSINIDTFDYTDGQTPVTQKVNTGYVLNYSSLTSRTRELGWQNCVSPSVQYQIFEFEYILETDNRTFKCDIAKLDDLATNWPTIKVFVNNELLIASQYTVTVTSSTTIITLNSDVEIPEDTRVQVLLLSDQVSSIAYYEIPINLSNNPFNEDVTVVNVGDIRGQYASIFFNNPNSEGQVFGENNYRDLGNVVPYGNKIVQNSASLGSVGALLRNPNTNLFNSISYNSNEYVKFKTLLIDVINKTDYEQRYDPSYILDDALEQITISKTNSQPFFWSDMLPSKTPFVSNSYTFSNTLFTTDFPLSQVYSFTEANYNSVLVYLTRRVSGINIITQLIRNQDYVVSDTSPSLSISVTLLPNDIITIKEYNQTYGSFVPNTPTKLGLYPATIPSVVLDTDYNTPTYFIQGHDGSYNKLFGEYNAQLNLLIDFRDQALLEFETRIYNNLKLSSTTPIDIYDLIPGEFRETVYSYPEWLEMYSVNFLNWVGQNRLDYKTQFFNASNQFTYNYWESQDKLSKQPISQGYWRGIYEYFYDTFTPNLTPWEMLGYTNKPTWWDTRYGEAPYTGDNLVLWEDLSLGYDYNDGNPIIREKFIRPGLLDIIPSDSSGNIKSPFVTVVGNYITRLFQRDWKVGDVSPVELAYKRSSTYPFDLMKMFALMQPAKFYNLGIDLDNYKFNSEFNQYLVNNRSHLVLKNIDIYGSGTAKTSYLNWIVDYNKQYGLNATTDLKTYLSNLDVRLVYRLAGFSDKSQLKFFVEKGSPNDTSVSLLIPDESYSVLLYDNQPFDRIIYSGLMVQKVESGFAVYGNSQLLNYFTTLKPKFDSYITITVGNLSLKLANTFFENEETVVPYRTVFASAQEVSQFILNYGAYLEKQGMVFDQLENTISVTWQQMVAEFLYWMQTGWANGSIVTLNPAARTLTINRESSVVQPLTLQQSNFVLNQNLYPIKSVDLAIIRNDTLFSLTALNEGDAMSYGQFNIGNMEHGIVFNNLTIFDDVIYNPITAIRQNRIYVKGSKSADWNGLVDAFGFILNQDNIQDWTVNKKYTKGEIVKYKNKYWIAITIVPASQTFNENLWKITDYNEIQKGLLPNSSTRSYESTLYYDTNSANLERDADLLSFSLIGYRPRNYLNSADLTDITQVNVYKNLIKNKGSINSINAFKGVDLPQGGIQYDTYENWAIKVGSYGGVLNSNAVELRLQQSSLTGNPSIVQITDGTTETGAQQVVSINNLTNYTLPITNANILPTISASTPNKVFNDAGYVNFNDVKMTSYFYSNLPLATNTKGNVVPIQNFYVRDYVWLANFLETWNVFTPTSLGQVIAVNNNANNTATVTFNTPHNLQRYQPFAIVNFDINVDGYYIVGAIVDTYRVLIAINLDPSITQIVSNGIGLKLQSQRVATTTEINTLPLLDSEFRKNTVWVDTNDDGSWAVYRKNIGYSLVEDITKSPSLTFGSAVAYTGTAGYVIGDSGLGKLYRYVYSPLFDVYNLVQTITKEETFGSVITYGSDVFVVSQPTVDISTITLSTVEITSTDGEFSCSTVSPNALKVGQKLTISGTFGGTGSITGYSNPTTYYIIETNGLTTFKLSATPDGLPITTTAGIPTGLTYTLTLTYPQVFVYQVTNNSLVNEFTQLQYIPSPAGITDWGSAVALSGDQNWLYISDIDNNTVYVYRNTQKIVTASVTATDGVTNKITLSGLTDAISLEDQITFTGTGLDDTNIETGTVYYVNSIDGSDITIKTSLTSPTALSLQTKTPITNTNAAIYTYAYENVTTIDGDSLGLTTAGDQFSYSLSTNYYGDTLVVGTPYEDYSGTVTDFGYSYVFTRSAQNIEVQQPTSGIRQTFALAWTPSTIAANVIATTTGTNIITLSSISVTLAVDDPIIFSGTGLSGTNISTNVVYYVSNISGNDITIKTSIGAVSDVALQTKSSITGTTVALISTATADVTDTTTGTNIITLSSISGTIAVDDPIIFSGTGLADTNISTNVVYYVSYISGSDLRIKTSIDALSDVALQTKGSITGTTIAVQKDPLFITVNGIAVTDNNYAVVGSNFVYVGDLNAGDIINVSGQVFTLQQTLDTERSPQQGARFGTSVDVNYFGSEILVGAPFQLFATRNEGAVYRYTNTGSRYGIISGSTNTNVTSIRPLLINGYLVNIPVGNATSAANAINSALITNVTAIANDGKLTISLVNSQIAPANQKLVLTSTNENTFAELGLTVYDNSQIISCPHAEERTQFGTVVKFNEYGSFVASAPVGTRYSVTTFDFTDDENQDNDTIFDNNATQFLDTFANAGAVYMFDYLPTYNEGLSNPGLYVYAQSINSTDQTYGSQPLYGNALDFNEYTVMVGAPTQSTGQVTVYSNQAQTKDWELYRYSAPVVDINKIFNTLIFSAETNNTLVNLDYFDPLQGKILGAARQNIDVISDVDPAGYNSGGDVNGKLVWGPAQLGQIWFNTSNVKYVNYHQNDDVVYNSQYWGTLFPGSDVAVYSWISSSEIPINYTGSGTPFNFDAYTTQYVINDEGTLTPVYFYWVRNSNILFVNQGKTLADSIIERYLQSPKNSGISYFAPLLQNTFGIYNSAQYINANDSILNIGYATGNNDDVVHNQYNLIRANYADDFLPGVPTTINDMPMSLYDRLLDSLAGLDEEGGVVPDPYLPKLVQSGIYARPRQSFFYNRLLALKNYLTYANTVLAQFPITELKPNLSLLNSASDNFPKTFTALSTNSSNNVITLQESNATLDINEPIVFSEIDILAVRSLSFGNLTAGTTYYVTEKVGSNGIKVSTIIGGTEVTLTTVSASPATSATITSLIGQAFNTQNYWEYVNWWAPGYSNSTKPAYQVNIYGDLSSLNVANGTIVSVLQNNVQGIETYIKTIAGWERIGLQNGTIQFKSVLWDYSEGRIGFGDNFFDTTPFDSFPAEETRKIIRALNEQIYTEELLIFRNKSLILLFEYIQSESLESQNYLPWLNKTSLVDVFHTIRELVPLPNLQADNQEFLEGYILEAKPYHVVIKEFVFKYTGTDTYDGEITDFDLPSKYNTSVDNFISPQLVYSNPDNVYTYELNSDIWQEQQYQQWYNNRGVKLSTYNGVPITKLASYIALNTTQMVVENINSFPVTGTIVIDDEIIVYNNIDRENSLLLELQRGVDGTTISTHIPGTVILINLPQVAVMNSGRGYTEPPEVYALVDTTVFPPPITPAMMQPVMNGDKVIAITVTNPGNGYMTIPEIVIEPAVTVTFGSSDITYASDFITLPTSSIALTTNTFITGDLVQYKLVTGNGVGSLVNNQWYYVNVLEIVPNYKIGLYNNLQDCVTDTNRIDLINLGSGSYTLNLGAKAIAIVSSSPVRENNTTIKFDRTSYTSQVTNWEAGNFYSAKYATTTQASLESSGSGISLQSTTPPIANILASFNGSVFEITDVTNDQQIIYSSLARQVQGTDATNDSIILDIGSSLENTSLSTVGFYVGMPIKFVGNTIGGLSDSTTYYVHSILGVDEFTVSTVFGGDPTGSPVALSTATATTTLECFAAQIVNTAVVTVNYPRIRTVTATATGTNKVTIPYTLVGTGGTNGFYTGLPIFFTGTVFGGIRANETYYVTTVVDGQKFTLSESASPKEYTVLSTATVTNVITLEEENNTLSINEPIIFTNMQIAGVAGTTFGGLVAGTTYYVSELVGDFGIKVSASINGSVFSLSTVAAATNTSATMTSQIDTVDLSTATGSMTLNMDLPVSPGQMNGKLVDFYTSSGQYTSVTASSETLISLDIEEVKNTTTLTGGIMTFQTQNNFYDANYDTMYVNMPVEVSVNIGSLTAGTPYYIVGLDRIEVTVTATSAAGNALTCDTTDLLYIDMPITFQGGSGIGGLNLNYPYYVESIIDSTNFTVSTTIGGAAVTVANGTGSMTGYGRQYVQLSTTISGTPVSTGNATASTQILNQTPTATPAFSVSYVNGGYRAIVTTSGSGYALNNTLTLLGTNIGGTSPANDLTLTVVEIGTNGEIEDVICQGDPADTTNSYYLKTISASEFELYSEPTLTIPVSGIGLPFDGILSSPVTGTDSVDNEITVESGDNFEVNDLVVFTGTITGGALVIGAPYYIETKSTNVFTISTTPGGSTFSIGSITITTLTMAKLGSTMTLTQPYFFKENIVKFNNRLYVCKVSNNDSEFVPSKWEFITSGDPRLNALDRIVGYYDPTINMPGLDLTQLVANITYPNVTYLNNAFEPSLQYTYDSEISDRAFTSTTPTTYDLQGATFTYGYGPEELVPGVVTDSMTMIVNTTAGTTWDATIYQHVGYGVVSREFTPTSSSQTVYSFANLAQVPAQISVYEINGTTNWGQRLFNSEFTVDWVNKIITLNTPLTFLPVANKLLVNVYEVGNGNQVVKGSTDTYPLITNEDTNVSEIFVDYLYNNGVVMPSTTTVWTQPIVYLNGSELTFNTDYTIEKVDATDTNSLAKIVFATEYNQNTDYISFSLFGDSEDASQYGYTVPQYEEIIYTLFDPYTFTLSNFAGQNNPNNAIVELNGLRLTNSQYSINGSTNQITISAGLTNNDVIGVTTYNNTERQYLNTEYGITGKYVYGISAISNAIAPFAAIQQVSSTTAASDRITFSNVNNMTVGQTVVFKNSGATPFGGVATNGTVYYIVTVNTGSNYIQISTTQGGSVFDITADSTPASTYAYVGGQPAVRVTFNTATNLVTNDIIRIDGVVGSVQLNNNIYYVHKISTTQFDLYTDTYAPALNAVNYPVEDVSTYVSGGFGWDKNNFLLPASAAATATTITTNEITVGNTSKLVVGTPVYFTQMEISSNPVTSFGGLQDQQEYYVREIVSGTKFTVSETRDGEEVTLSTASGTMNVTQWEQLDTSRIWVTVNGYKISSTLLKVNDINELSILTSISAIDTVIITTMMPSATPNQEKILLNVNENSAQTVYREVPSTTTWLVEDLYSTDTEISVYDASKLVTLSTQSSTTPAAVSSKHYIGLNASRNLLLTITVYNETKGLTISSNDYSIQLISLVPTLVIDADSSYISTGDVLTITITEGKFIYVAGEQIHFSSVDLVNNKLGNLQRGVNTTGSLGFISKYTTIYALLNTNRMDNEFIDETWNSNVYNTTEGDPLQISDTVPAIFLRTDEN